MTGRLTGSDVQGKFILADAQALDADGISAAAAVGNNAALTIGGALADGGSVTNVSGLSFNANTMCARVGVNTGGGLTVGRAGCMDTANDDGQYIDIDAEL